MRNLLKKRPEPNKKKVHKVKIVKVRATLINKTDEGYNRSNFLQRYKNKVSQN